MLLCTLATVRLKCLWFASYSSSLSSLSIHAHSSTHVEIVLQYHPHHEFHSLQLSPGTVLCGEHSSRSGITCAGGEKGKGVESVCVCTRWPCKFVSFMLSCLVDCPLALEGTEYLDSSSSLRLGIQCGGLRESINSTLLTHPISEPSERYKGSEQMETE